MAQEVPRERLEIQVSPAMKRQLLRWARRMDVSAGALLEYCYHEAEAGIREQLASLEDDVRDESDELTDGEVSDIAFERFGRAFVYGLDPVL
jgi:hypothetical protein